VIRVGRAAVDVAGRVVAVTGGANGIGLEIARQLAAAGAHVAIGDVDGEAAGRAAEQLEGRGIGLHLDVTDTGSFGGFLDEVAQRLGPIDVLVNNAGVMWVGRFEAEPETAIRRQVEVNLLGVIRGVRLAAPAMTARGSGHIVTIASAASFLAPPGEATYAATKHGVLGYLTAVREELHRSGVILTVVMPAVVDTALAVGTATGVAKMLQPSDVARSVVRAIQHPRPRFHVFLPRYVNPLNRAVGLLPARLRDGVTRQLVPNQVHQADGAARRGYEATFTDRDAQRPGRP
jgi:short-subunit dehydrogenase